MFGKRQNNLCTFNIGNYFILSDDNVKILVLNVDDNKLNVNTHISKISGASFIYIVLDQPIKMLLYDSFVECYFDFCSDIWHFCSKTNNRK